MFTDSYYTSIQLAKELEEKGIGLCGSIAKNHKDLPSVNHKTIQKNEMKTFWL